MNYMDYTNDACMNLFTNGQKDRMRALFVAGGARESFISAKIQQSPAVVCGSGPFTFSVAANQGAAVTYTWTVTGALQLSSGQGTNQITCSRFGPGSATITVSANGYCDSRTIEVEASGTYSNGQFGTRVPLAGSYQSVPAGGRYYIWMDQPYDFAFTSVGPNGSAGVPVTKTSPQNANFYFSGGSVQIKATATATSGPCPATLSSVFAALSSFAVAPNPASSDLTVTAVAPGNAITKDAFPEAGELPAAAPFDAELYDMFGRKVKPQKSVHGKVIFNLLELPNGLYNLRVGQGKNVYTERIQVAH